jgi:dihydrolipoamide dehydrogenase
MAKQTYAAVVIGSGPGGYPCGIKLGQLGVDALVVEKEEPGGVCLNVGCIPSKALIHAAKSFEKMKKAADIGILVDAEPRVDMDRMQDWKGGVVKKLTGGVKQLLKANGTDLALGTARIGKRGPDGFEILIESSGSGSDGARTVTTKNVVVATGSRPIEIPGFEIDQKRVIDSTGALDLRSVPKRMVVIGGGYIGLELGTVYAKLGSKVTVVEMLDSVLAGMDEDCVRVVARKLNKMGIEVLLGAKAKKWEDKGDRAVLTVETKDGEATIDADVILLSIGRRPNSRGIGLEEAGVRLDDKGFVPVDSQLRTNVPGIYAIGDVAGGMMLAHKATKEGEVVAEVIAGKKAAMDLRTMPAVVFTDPEIASTGMTEPEAKAAGRKIRVGKFPFAALGRALSVNDTEGFCKVIADAETEEILGLHVVGNGASDLVSEGALAIEMGAVLHDMSLTVHPHPTLSEALMESAGAALGEAIHIVNR